MTRYGEKDESPTADAAVVTPGPVEDDPPPDGGYGWIVCFVRISPFLPRPF